MSRRSPVALMLAASLALGAAGAAAPTVTREAAGVFALLSSRPAQGVTFTVTRADPVERELHGLPWGGRLFTTFLTVTQVNGREVPLARFWREARVGRVIQAKIYPRSGLTWAARINVLTN